MSQLSLNIFYPLFHLCYLYRFESILPFKSSAAEMDKLSEEFIEFQLLHDENIPKQIWDQATVKVDAENDKFYHRMDIIWHYLSSLKAPDHTARFSRLSRIAMLALLIPHSNAQEERIFSMVRKNKTAFRPNLDPRGTLSSILTIKLANDVPAHQFEPTKDLLKTAKSATWNYNKEHSNK